MRQRIGGLIAVLVALAGSAQAQCALCRASVESASDPTLVSGFHAATYLLLIVPYLLGGWIAYRWFRSCQP